MSKSTGFLNSVINKLPLELHLPGYQFCGPGTNLQHRLALGQKGINQLDAACRKHDIAYAQNKDLKYRHIADNILSEEALKRLHNKDARLSERLAAWAVNKTMRAKVKLGMGVKKRKPSIRAAIISARNALKDAKPKTHKSAIEIALRAAKKTIGNRKNEVVIPRVIPVAKSGGILPFLIPLFAGLSAVGGLAGGAAGIAKAVNDASSAGKQLKESERHNKTMEAIALGGHGKGLHLAPYKKGWGLYLHPYIQKKKS